MAMTTGENQLHLPSKAGRVAIEEYTRRSQERVRFDWGVPTLDAHMTPLMGGDLVTIIGRPGHAKTSVAIHLLRRANSLLLQEQGGVKRYAVYATWETLVEEFVAIYLADSSGQTMQDIGRGQADLGKLEAAIAGSIRNRVAVIGSSMESPSVPSLQGVDDTIRRMAENGTPAGLLICDYLQRIPGRPGQDRSAMVTENLEYIKDLGMRHRIPTVVPVQSKRDVDEYKGLQMPSLADAQWSSNIEQTSDKVIGITRPSLYLEQGKILELGAEKYRVTPKLLAWKINKQRWANSGEVLMLNFDPRLASITDAIPLDDEGEGEMF